MSGSVTPEHAQKLFTRQANKESGFDLVLLCFEYDTDAGIGTEIYADPAQARREIVASMSSWGGSTQHRDIVSKCVSSMHGVQMFSQEAVACVCLFSSAVLEPKGYKYSLSYHVVEITSENLDRILLVGR